MGQIIRLAVPAAAYPEAMHLLEPTERTFVQALRGWVSSYRRGEDPLPDLCEIMRLAGAHDAAFSVDRLMAVIARSARRPMAIRCQRCPYLSADEKHLVHAASLAQAGESEAVERTLRTALLSASGAEFALGPLEGLGELFAEAKLFFRRRISPAADARSADPVEAWSPPSPVLAGSLN